MGHMRITQQQVVRADARGQVFLGAAVHRAVLTKHIVVAHFQIGRLPVVFEVLGFPADRREGEKLVAAPEFRVPFEHHMRVQHALVSQFDVGPDHAERADADVVSNLGERRDNGGRVDHRRNFRESTHP